MMFVKKQIPLARAQGERASSLLQLFAFCQAFLRSTTSFAKSPKQACLVHQCPQYKRPDVLTTLKQTNCHLTYTNINVLHVTCLPVICTQAQENRLLLRKQTKTFYARDKQKPSMRTTSPTYVTRLNVFMHKPRHPRTTSASRQGLGRRHVRQTGI